MNERIKELALQAGYLPDMFGVGHWHMPECKKFAELIVRECVEQGKLIQSQTTVNGSEEYNAGREVGIEVFMNQVKQHFGVEHG